MAFKTFTAGSVLTAADVNDYLMEQTVISCTSGTRPASPNEGMTIYETDTNRYMFYNGAAWDYVFGASIRKTADESVTSSTSMQDDNELLIAVAANTNYIFEGFIIYDGATAGDIIMGWSGPAGSTIEWFADSLINSATTGVDAVARTYQTTGTPSGGALGAGSNVFANPRGIIQVAGTAGNLQFRWAQLASSGTATRVRAGSMLTVRRAV